MHAGQVAPCIRLSAAHACCADHYTGINENWSAGPIYCSEVTAQLVVHLTGVQQQFVHPLPMEKPVVIQGTMHTTALPASHLTPPATQWPHMHTAHPHNALATQHQLH